MMGRIAEASPLFKARAAGFFWLLTFASGMMALVSVRGRLVANLIATACYVGATLFIYALLKPVNRGLSLFAAFVSIAGCAMGVLIMFQLTPSYVHPLVFFGLHCLLVGYLILTSTFLPRFVGVLMLFAGIGWLTFLWPPFAIPLIPYNMFPGMLGEATLTLWLLVKGVDVDRWQEQARAAGQARA